MFESANVRNYQSDNPSIKEGYITSRYEPKDPSSNQERQPIKKFHQRGKIVEYLNILLRIILLGISVYFVFCVIQLP